MRLSKNIVRRDVGVNTVMKFEVLENVGKYITLF